MSTVRSAAFDLAGVAQASLRRAANMLHLAGDAENARKFDEEAERCRSLYEGMRPLLAAEFDELFPPKKQATEGGV